MKRLVSNLDEALSEVIFYQKQIDAFYFIKSDPYHQSSRYEEDKYLRESLMCVSNMLHSRLNDAYSKLLLWSGCVGEKQRIAASKLAIDRYITYTRGGIKQKMSNSDGYPHEWNDEKEKEFIQKLKAEFSLQLLKKQSGIPLKQEEISFLEEMAAHQGDTKMSHDIENSLLK